MNKSFHDTDELDVATRIIHLGLILFGISAWLTGDLAGDFEEGETLGYNIHSWLGLALALVIVLRLGYGFVGPANIRFFTWLPVTRARLGAVWDDIRAMLLLKLPDGPLHHGLAGLVQAAGLLLFAWMAATGTWLYFYLVPGQEAGGFLHLVEELHEVGEELIPFYLVLHVGAAVLHALAGRHKWRKMFFVNRERGGKG